MDQIMMNITGFLCVAILTYAASELKEIRKRLESMGSEMAVANLLLNNQAEKIKDLEARMKELERKINESI